MKTKGLNFLEAVKAMKEGKKVGLQRWGCQRPIMFKNKNPQTLDLIYKIDSDDTTSKEIEYVNGVECRIWHPTILELEATDWEIVDEDKDWNLAECLAGWGTEPAKKCRDLILEDFQKIPPAYSFEKMINVVNKRFGDLE